MKRWYDPSYQLVKRHRTASTHTLPTSGTAPSANSPSIPVVPHLLPRSLQLFARCGRSSSSARWLGCRPPGGVVRELPETRALLGAAMEEIALLARHRGVPLAEGAVGRAHVARLLPHARPRCGEISKLVAAQSCGTRRPLLPSTASC